MDNNNSLNHLAIIMDGNGRWARKLNKERFFGHNSGIKSVRESIDISLELGVKQLTLYAFSSENWNRPETEVSAIMKLLFSTIRKEIDNLDKNNVRLTTIGNLNDLPKETRKNIKNGISQTQDNTGLNLILALSYGSRQELIRAIRRIGNRIESSQIKSDDITDDVLESELYSAGVPDPDLVIRTGGEYRLSNFLLWQAAYSELLITEKHWPEFRENELLNGIIDYQNRQRRFGQTDEQVKA